MKPTIYSSFILIGFLFSLHLFPTHGNKIMGLKPVNCQDNGHQPALMRELLSFPTTNSVEVATIKVKLNFLANDQPIRQQVHIEVYHTDRGMPTVYFRTTDGNQEIDIYPDKDSVVVWCEDYKTIRLNLKNTNQLYSLDLHFYTADNHDELKSITGYIRKKTTDDIIPYENLHVDFVNTTITKNDLTGDGGLLDPRGKYNLDDLDSTDKNGTVIIYGQMLIKMYDINDDVELDVTIDGDLPMRTFNNDDLRKMCQPD